MFSIISPPFTLARFMSPWAFPLNTPPVLIFGSVFMSASMLATAAAASTGPTHGMLATELAAPDAATAVLAATFCWAFMVST